jgi:dTDP-4-dehydrorhamnose reductase
MRFLVSGANGMLGRDAVSIIRAAGHQVTAADRATLDVTDAQACVDAVAGHDIILNCAAWTAVDDAETHEAEAFVINAIGAANLTRAVATAGARLVQISTDYVFDGSATRPYAEDAICNPVSAYGRTKLAGEWATRAGDADCLVVRTAWLYGAHGPCFPKTIARVAAGRDSLDVVDDQHGQPTWTADVAKLVLLLIERSAPSGVYHATSSGTTTWCEFARAVVASAGNQVTKVRPTTSAAYARPAPRPAWSVLGHDRLRDLNIAPIGSWDERWAVAAPEVLARAGKDAT